MATPFDAPQIFQMLQQRMAQMQQQRAALAPQSGQSILDQMNQGPTQGQQDLVQQIINARFQQGSDLLQRQAQQLSAGLSSSAAARGLAKSSIGLGQQGLLGQSVLQQLGGLQQGLQAQGAQQLFQVPYMNAQLAMGLRGQDINRELGFANIDIQRQQLNQSRGGGFGLGNLFGMAAGSILGPFGAAGGNFLANQFFGGNSGGGGGGGGYSGAGYNYNAPY